MKRGKVREPLRDFFGDCEITGNPTPNEAVIAVQDVRKPALRPAQCVEGPLELKGVHDLACRMIISAF
jgi:hypothetical protein